MISSIRRNRKACEQFKTQIMGADQPIIVPNHFRCPISLDLMKDPVTLSTGITFDRESIERWIEGGNLTCPVTKQVLINPLDLIPNHVLRRMIQDWCVQNYRYGIERIPTPRIPVNQTQVAEILSRVTTAAQRLDHNGCRKSLEKIKALGKESERNRRCFAANGTAVVLAAAFNTFALSASFGEHRVIMEEILSLITWISYQLNDSDALSFLGSKSSFNCLVQLLLKGNSSDLSGRRNAAVALKRLLSSDQRHVEWLAETEGAMETLFKLIEEPICPTTTKACLTIVFYLVSSSSKAHRRERVKSRFVEMGLVSLLLETLVDAEKSVAEKSLGVLDELCECKEGKEKALRHPLAVPVMVKKIHRVSDLGTEFAVSILWKLLKNIVEDKDEDGLVLEALEMGAFQKLLLLLQVGCVAAAKDKATKLLKLLHRSQSRLECPNLIDYKKLKIPF